MVKFKYFIGALQKNVCKNTFLHTLKKHWPIQSYRKMSNQNTNNNPGIEFALFNCTREMGTENFSCQNSLLSLFYFYFVTNLRKKHLWRTCAYSWTSHLLPQYEPVSFRLERTSLFPAYVLCGWAPNYLISIYFPWNHQRITGFSHNFRGNGSQLICLISLDIRSKIWSPSLKRWKVCLLRVLYTKLTVSVNSSHQVLFI